MLVLPEETTVLYAAGNRQKDTSNWIRNGDASKFDAEIARGNAIEAYWVSQLLGKEAGDSPPTPEPARWPGPSLSVRHDGHCECEQWRGVKRSMLSWGELPSISALLYSNALAEKSRYDIEAQHRAMARNANFRLFDRSGNWR